MRILIAGGGTGGHIIPALAIAQQLRDRHSCEVIFAGTARGMETRLVPEAGYELRLLKVGQLNRVSLTTRVKTLFALPMAIGSAWRMLGELRPSVVVSVGGYASGPAAIAAVLRRIPLLVFEPNVVPGFANRRVARFAANAAVHFEETGRWFRRYEVTGVPVRAPFFALPEKSAGPRTLLLFGGSQGARALNRVLVASLGELKKRLPELRIIHQTGEREFESIAEAYRQAGVEARVSAFIRNMPEVFAEADLIVCRSGASTVAEVAAAGRAAIFVPLPTAADDHQRRNAETLVRQGAALMISEAELTPERFVAEVVSLLDDEARLRSVGAAARRLAHPAAAERIAEMAVELAAQK